MGKFLLFNKQFTKAASMGSLIFTPSPDNFHLHVDSLTMKLLQNIRYLLNIDMPLKFGFKIENS